MATYLLGLDIGTSACKGAIFDTKGTLICAADSAYPTAYPQPGWAEQAPEDWWRAACQVIRALLARWPGRPTDIAGISVAGQSWAMAAVDAQGQVLTPSPLWRDTRATDICAQLECELPALADLSGNPVVAGYTTPKVLWLKAHAPDLYRRAACVLQSNGYIVYRLTDQFSQDVSQGYGWHCFSNRTLQWDEDAVRALGIDQRLLPPIFACHDIVGRVTEQAARETGLPAGVPVVAGGLDAACGTLGVGVIDAGQAQEQAGQAGGMSLCLDRYVMHPKLILSAHTVPGRWLLQGGTTGGSGALRWLRSTCCPELSYAEMDALAQTAPPLCDGLVFLPYMAGERSPLWLPEARGVFCGLSFATNRAEMIRAVLEGVAFALRHNLDTAAEVCDLPTVLRSSGGGARSPLWLSIKAAVSHAAMEVADAEYATVRGAALVTGVGVRAVAQWDAWCQNQTFRRIDPAPGLQAVYEEGYARYRALISAMLPIYQKGSSSK